MTRGLEYPLRDLDAAMGAVLDRCRADADGVGPTIDLRVDPGFARPGSVADGPPVDHVVAVVGGHVFAAGFAVGLEQACAAVMSGFQDDAVDALGRPWPEVVEPGGASLGVLDVGCDPLGIAHWSLRGRVLCAVGQLVPSCRARGWRVR